MTAPDPLAPLRERSPFRLADRMDAHWILDKHGTRFAKAVDSEDCRQGLAIAHALNLALDADAKLAEKDKEIAQLKTELANARSYEQSAYDLLDERERMERGR